MGVDLILKKGEHKISFGRSYHYDHENNGLIKYDIEKIKSLLKYEPKNIEDLHNVDLEIDSFFDDLIDQSKTLGKKELIDCLKKEGYKEVKE
jgi:hypothetical protein